MKIVSKYKDFYDFLAQDYEADIIYVREPMVFYTNHESLYKDKNKIYLQRRYSGFYNPRVSKGSVTFGSYVFGVYPNVYSQPCAVVHYELHSGFTSTECIVLTKSVADSVKDGNVDALYDYCRKNISDHAKFCLNDVKLKVDAKDVYSWLSKYIWKVECKDIFDVLKAPVFIEYNSKPFEQSCYWINFDEIKAGDNIGKARSPKYITNISFAKLNDNILKYWFDELNDLNTYINIENFLWSIKQEPESVPDNNTKIVSHGFDLKTSFRKM